MSVKLIAIDLDGTLLNSHHQISPNTKSTIQSARNKGIHIILTSGRPFLGIAPYLEELGLNDSHSYCISNNGAVVHHANDGEHLIEDLLDFEDYLYFESLSREIGVHFHALSQNQMYTANHNISHYTVMDAYLTQTPLNYCAIEAMDNAMNFTKFMMIDHPNVLENGKAFIPQNAFSSYNIISTSPYFLEVSSKSASKGHAVQQLTEKLGITRDKVMCIGDQNNDISMIEFASVGVAMGNAVPALKDKAQFITQTNDEDGVAVAIQKFI